MLQSMPVFNATRRNYPLNRLGALFALVFTPLLLLSSASSALAQGCVAAHSQPQSEDVLLSNAYHDGGAPGGHEWLHRLTLNIGYRSFSSNEYFIGTHEIPRAAGRRVENHQNIWDVGINYQVTPRWSAIADVPVFQGTRNQVYPPSGVFSVGGIGDVTIGAQAWIFRPPTEGHGNIAFSASLKIPTGIDNATSAALLNGQMVTATADQSLQPGDGGWGFLLASQAYQRVWFHTMTYFQGEWLFNPEDTNGVPTFRRQPGQGVMSVPDQYLFRGGFAHAVPKIRGLDLSFGARMEGIPVRDAFGASNGFRRPGYIISIDPGFMYSVWHETISVNAPWAVQRDRRPSVPEMASNTPNGDAFFADYTIIVVLSHYF
jgi:hypothetical protein